MQEVVGGSYQVSAQTKLFDAAEDELHGGRADDAERAADIQHALVDSAVAAIVSLRGGAWFTRILPRIDFSTIDRRTAPVAFFGFSELTPLANIIGAHAMGRGFYDMGPAFLAYGLRYFAERNPDVLEKSKLNVQDWVRAQTDLQFREFFRRCIQSIENRRTIELEASLLRGNLSDSGRATFVGGNLTVLSTMIGSRYEPSIAPDGRWLVLEDYNDKPERFDRFLAHCTLAGYFDRCEGVLLGDFHSQERDLAPAIVEMLRHHIPTRTDLPILYAPTVGHTWPMDTLPLHERAVFRRDPGGRVVLHWACR